MFVEVRRTRRAHSIRPGEDDTSRRGSHARSPSPLRSSGRDSSWRDKLGAGEKTTARDTLDVEKPSKILFCPSCNAKHHLLIKNVKNVEIHRNFANNYSMLPFLKVAIIISFFPFRRSKRSS